MGLSGTFVGRNLIASAGLMSTGIMATAFQALVLCSAAVIYHLHLAPAAVVQVPPFLLAEPDYSKYLNLGSSYGNVLQDLRAELLAGRF